MVKKIILILFFWVGYLFSGTTVLAKDFSSFYKTTYRFDSSGRALVTQEVSLKNNSSDVYVSEYTLSLSGTKIEDIIASDSLGPIKTTQIVKDQTTLITLVFNEKAAGLGKYLNFVLKYKTDDLAVKQGNLWEITIPKLGNSEEIEKFDIVIQVPDVLGNPAYINPKPDFSEKKDNYYELGFTKEKLTTFGVNAVFGNWQTFSFSLDYDLENPSSSSYVEKIAIPPDTLYQDVVYSDLDPRPKNIEIDEDGNWLASYEIPANSQISVKATGYVNLYLYPKKIFPKQTERLNDYLKEDKYWETGNEKIITLATKLTTPKEIYEYVVKTLTYDKTLIKESPTRKGAVLALENPSSSLCSEFTDLFVALCRAAKIPARELEGFAYSEESLIDKPFKNKDILHSWPEYYDLEKGEWIMVDPTFEDTTNGFDFFGNLDMNHFVFVTHGIKSNYPYPAGSYKTVSSGKQIQINYGKEESSLDQGTLLLESVKPQRIYSLRKNKVDFVFKNDSGKALYYQNIAFDSNLYLPDIFFIQVVPPFSKYQISTYSKPKESFFDYKLNSKIVAGDGQIDFTQKVFSFGLRAIIGGSSVLCIIIILTLKSLVKRKKQISIV